VKEAKSRIDEFGVDKFKKTIEKNKLKSKPLQEGVEKVGKEIPKAKPKVEVPEVKKSKLAQRINEELPDDYKIDEYYDPIIVKNELSKAGDDISKNKSKALKEAFDRNTKANERVAKLVEFAEIAKRDGDYNSFNAIASKLRKEGTEAGQELNMFKAYGFLNPETKFMKDVVNARLKKIAVGEKDIQTALKKANEKLTKNSEVIRGKVSKELLAEESGKLLDKLIC
jgi:hypothetical protein